MKTGKPIIFIGIAVITIFTRLYNLNNIPPHLSNDEISIAYDAYSVLKTGKDEHGAFLPLSFQSHNTYKAPLSAYLTVPSIALFGNTTQSARLPSVIAGSLTVLFIGLLVYELSQNFRLALVSGFLLSITPWHIYTSRMILESNIALFCVVCAIYLFLRGIRKNNPALLYFSPIFFSLSIYGYHTEWGFTPLILISLFLAYKNYFIHHKKSLFIVSFLFIITAFPIFLNFVKNLHTNARANTEIILKEPHLKAELDQSPNYKKVGLITAAIIGNYSSYINPGTLFFNGLQLFPNKDPYDSGLLLAVTLPFFFYGITKIRHYLKGNSLFFIIWLLLGPLIPSATLGGPNFIRNLVSVIPYTITISLGVNYFFYLNRKKIVPRFILLTLILANFLTFFTVYSLHFSKENGLGFQYGYREIAQYLKDVYPHFQEIIIDPRFGKNLEFDGVPHLYISYYTKLNPQSLLARKSDNYGLHFDKYNIRGIDWQKENLQPFTLYIVPYSNTLPEKLSNILRKIKEVRYPNQDPDLEIYTYDPI